MPKSKNAYNFTCADSCALGRVLCVQHRLRHNLRSARCSAHGGFCHIHKKRYDRLNELNNYLALICAGNYNLDINENTEGELSILKTIF